MTKQISFNAMRKLLLISIIFLSCNSAEEAKKFIELADSKKLSDPTGALADYTKAIELDPANYYPYYQRGSLKDGPEMQDYLGANEDYDCAIKLIEKKEAKTSFDEFAHGYLYFNRGANYVRLGEKEKACLDFNKASALGFDCEDYIKDHCK